MLTCSLGQSQIIKIMRTNKQPLTQESMRAIVKEVTGYDSTNVKVSFKYICDNLIVTGCSTLWYLQNIYQCVEETEYITDGSVPVPSNIGKVEQIGPSASAGKSAKGVPQMVSYIYC